MQTASENGSDNGEIVSQETSPVKEKPTPIYTCEITIKNLDMLLSSNPEIKDCYVIKPNTHDCATIHISTYEKYIIINNFLKERKVQFYSYTPKNLKNKKLVLKNLYGEYSVDEIASEIKKECDKKIEIVKIVRINKVIDYSKPICYLIIFKNNYETYNLKRLHRIFAVPYISPYDILSLSCKIWKMHENKPLSLIFLEKLVVSFSFHSLSSFSSLSLFILSLSKK